ncbi:MAG TPA: hypothetical protein VMP67_10150 [Candidatus Limnocylindria bacterium]|nr:hypothetical protein [Candidatus Limnocylindria bacterium]
MLRYKGTTWTFGRLRLPRAPFALVVGLLATLLLPLPGSPFEPPTARALSCLPADVNDQLAETDFAFIGRPQAEILPGQEGGTRRFVFDVEVWVKGNLGTPVTVQGFEWSMPEIGQRMAMIVSLAQEGVLQEQPCVGTSPGTLLAIAALYAETASEEPARVLIGGEFGDARVMALDALGRLVALGPGSGTVVAMAACPGGGRTVEVVAEFMYSSPAIITVRDAATLEVVREAGLPAAEEGFNWPGALSCRDEEGADVLLGLPGHGIGQMGDTLEPLHNGSFITVAIGRERAVVMERLAQPGEDGYGVALEVLDLESGERTALHEPSGASEPLTFVLSPDDTKLAFLERMPYGSEDEGMIVHVYDVAAPGSVGSYTIETPRLCDSCWGNVAWLDDTMLLVHERRWDESGQQIGNVRTISVPELEVVDEWPGAPLGNVGRVAGEVVLAIEHTGFEQRLVASPIDGGEPVLLRVLPTHNAPALVVLRDFDAGEASALLGLEAPTSPAPVPITPPPDRPATEQPAPASDDVSSSAPLVMVALAAVGVVAVLLIGGLALRRRRLASSRPK